MSNKHTFAGFVIAMCVLVPAGIHAERATKPRQIGYLLAKDTIVFTVTETNKTTRKVGVEGNELKVLQKTDTTFDGVVAVRTVGDSRSWSPLEAPKGRLSDLTFTVELAENGTLKSVNAASSGRVGDLLQSIAKIAGVVLGGFTGPFGAGDRALKCDPFTQPFLELSDPLRLFLSSFETACNSWLDLQKMAKDLDTLQKRRAALEAQIPNANPKLLEEIKAELQLLVPAINRSADAVNIARTAFQVRFDQWLASLDLGTMTETVVREEVFELADLPADGVIKGGETFEDLLKLTGSNTGGVAPLKKTTYERFKRLQAALTISALAEVNSAEQGPANDDELQLCYRLGQVRTITSFVLDSGGAAGDGTLKVGARSATSIVDPAEPATCTAFKRSALGDRRLTLAFDNKARLTKLERADKSDAAALTAAVATAATALRDETATTLTKVVDIQEAQRAIKLNDLTLKVEQLKQQKAVVDGQLALDSATLNVEAMLKQSKLAADLQTLQAEASLTAAQDTAAQRLEIERLKIAIEQLKQLVDLVKAQQELERANKK